MVVGGDAEHAVAYRVGSLGMKMLDDRYRYYLSHVESDDLQAYP